MRINNMRSAIVLKVMCLCAMAYLILCPQSAHAEGHKSFENAQGVNRVIRSDVGAYTTTSGTGTMNFINVPANGGRYGDKPSFYSAQIHMSYIITS